MNIKFRGGLLGFKDFKIFLELLLLSTAISKDVNAASWIKAVTTAIVFLVRINDAKCSVSPLDEDLSQEIDVYIYFKELQYDWSQRR
ncbi:hypothetical protein Tco_0613817 [Tanacetum coccineum]